MREISALFLSSAEASQSHKQPLTLDTHPAQDDRSCLHWAITGKHPEIVLWLLSLDGKAKAKVNKADEVGSLA